MIIPVFAVLELLFKVLLFVSSVFLILLVLVQRGRGGGLAGALGGMGGSSAFGAKAGDIFTKITVVAATVWIALCIAADKLGPATGSRIATGGAAVSTSSDVPAMESTAEDDADAADASDAPEGAPVAPGAQSGTNDGADAEAGGIQDGGPVATEPGDAPQD